MGRINKKELKCLVAQLRIADSLYEDILFPVIWI